VVLDEFPYLVKASPELPSAVQAAFGPRRPRRLDSRTRLVLCGSALSVMGRLLAGSAPLRGRAGLELVVPTLDFRLAPGRLGAGDDGWDADWLVVQGEVRVPGGRGWSFTDPCPTTWEARDFGRWLRRVAAGKAAVCPDPGEGAAGVLSFTEPNLAFSVESRARARRTSASTSRRKPRRRGRGRTPAGAGARSASPFASAPASYAKPPSNGGGNSRFSLPGSGPGGKASPRLPGSRCTGRHRCDGESPRSGLPNPYAGVVDRRSDYVE
jgi:hypothetical protein